MIDKVKLPGRATWHKLTVEVGGEEITVEVDQETEGISFAYGEYTGRVIITRATSLEAVLTKWKKLAEAADPVVIP